MMNSCLYKAQVMHHRLAPKRHGFHYRIFLFYIDLDELDLLGRTLRFMSVNRFNLFTFRDKDHLQWPREKPDLSKNTREQLVSYLETQGMQTPVKRIMLLTHLCTLGYQFNPVSFYYCFNEADEPLCSVVEVCNTYRELKPYFLGNSAFEADRFHERKAKNFYVSPFIDLDTHFDFDLGIPGDRLDIRIDDYSPTGNRFFASTLIGERKSLTDRRLLGYFFSFPMITLKVIAMIHWQALKLWLKKLPYHRKDDHPELQQDVYRPVNSTLQKSFARKKS